MHCERCLESHYKLVFTHKEAKYRSIGDKCMIRTSNISKNIILYLILLILCFILTACGETEVYRTTDPNEYLQTTGHISNEGIDIRSGLFIFPKSTEELKDVGYKYYCKHGVLDNSYVICLKGNYPDKESYESELMRLKSISCSIETSEETVINNIEYSDTLFDYPAYVSIYNTNLSFEYALADDEHNCVIYIYLKQCEGSDFLRKEYLPKEFRETSMMEYDLSMENQNIYYAPEANGDYVYYLD